MFEIGITLLLKNFCEALMLDHEGKIDEFKESQNDALDEFWKTISIDDRDGVKRGKLNCIQHPGLRYFVAFLTRGFLARDNFSSCTKPIMYWLKCAIDQASPTYNLGAMLARSLSLACVHNWATPRHCGGIATLVANYLAGEYGWTRKNYGSLAIGTNVLDNETLR